MPNTEPLQIAKLALEDGTVFTGTSFGAAGTTTGEVVFNTSMTGYQEILTDPSYRGQIVTMTYPEIGNYGVNEEDIESYQPHLAGFVIRNLSEVHSNYRSTTDLDSYLKSNNIVGIQGIDTRALVKHIRSQGAMKGAISTEITEEAKLVDAAKASQGLVGRDLVKEVTPTESSDWNTRLSDWWVLRNDADKNSGQSPHVVAMDFGMKYNIARHLTDQGCRVTIVPATATADEIMALQPDGVFLSNGPGDPEPLTYAIETISQLLGKAPIFGICLGHQLLSLACGAKTFKLKFGHRGANQPVQETETGKIEITTQNHGFAVDPESVPADLEITHFNLNDKTVAGVRHLKHPAFGVQYHPEAAAGPHDSQYLFGRFRKLIDDNRSVPA
jgi:carbamoyl-phosphate synthase small subunit